MIPITIKRSSSSNDKGGEDVVFTLTKEASSPKKTSEKKWIVWAIYAEGCDGTDIPFKKISLCDLIIEWINSGEIKNETCAKIDITISQHVFTSKEDCGVAIKMHSSGKQWTYDDDGDWYYRACVTFDEVEKTVNMHQQALKKIKLLH